MFLHTDVQKNIYIYHDSTSGGKKTVKTHELLAIGSGEITL